MAQNDTEREPTLLETPEEIRQALAASDPLISISPPAFTPPLPDQPGSY